MNVINTETRRLLMVLAFLSICTASAASAQSRCTVDDTLLNCWQEYLKPAAAIAAQTTDEKLRAVDSGLDLGGNTLQSTLSRLGFTAVQGDSDDPSQGDTRMALDLNFLLPGPIQERNGQLKFLVDTKPELFEPLNALLPEEDREQRITALEDQLPDLADYAVLFKYNWITPRWGRSFNAHQALFNQLFEAVPWEFNNPAFSDFINRYLVNVVPSAADDGVAGTPATFDQVDAAGQGSPGVEALTFLNIALQNLQQADSEEPNEDQIQAEAATILREFETVAAAELAQVQRFEGRVKQSGLKEFADLVNNQPQLLFSVERRLRDELIGPDETRLELTWEHPVGPNVNRLKNDYRERCEDQGVCPGLLAHYTSYIKKKPKKVDNADRAFFSLSYARIGDYSINRPNDGLVMDDQPFELEGGERLIIQAGFGSTIRFGPQRNTALVPTRLDFSASWEDVFDDPERQDRLLANLTFAIKLNDDLSVPVTFVYANKPEFLAMQDIDDKITARFGVKFTLPGDKPKEKTNGGN